MFEEWNLDFRGPVTIAKHIGIEKVRIYFESSPALVVACCSAEFGLELEEKNRLLQIDSNTCPLAQCRIYHRRHRGHVLGIFPRNFKLVEAEIQQ